MKTHDVSGSSPVRVVMRNNQAAKRANANNRRGIIATDSPTGDKWTYKRMSRSFDNYDSIEQAFRTAMEDEEERNEEAPEQVTVKSEKIQHYLNASTSLFASPTYISVSSIQQSHKRAFPSHIHDSVRHLRSIRVEQTGRRGKHE